MKSKKITGYVIHSLFSGSLLFMVTPSHAGGFIGYEVSTDEVALASSGSAARAQDASTVLNNPAGMTRLQGNHTLFGAQLLYGDINMSVDRTANQASGGDGGNIVGLVPGGSAFVSYSASPDVKLGLGLASNFGSTLEFDSGWTGRYYGKKATLIGVSVLPSVAFKATDKLSLGASLNAMYGIFEDQVAINNRLNSLSDGELKLEDKDWGYGLNLGLIYEFTPDTRIGFTYTSEVNFDFKSKAKYSNLGPGIDALLTANGMKNAQVDIGMHVPQTAMLSLFHQVNEGWAVLSSVGWQDWSRFGRVDISVDANNPKSVTAKLPFKDTWHAAVGAQYRFRPQWLLSFGLAYDSQFQNDSNVSPMLPTNEAWRFGLGVNNLIRPGLAWGVAAEYLYGGNQDVNKTAVLPVTGLGRGDLKGTFEDEQIVFLSANLKWEF